MPVILRRTFVGVASAMALRAAEGRKTTDKPTALGGQPVRTREYPSWPRVGKADEQNWMEMRSGMPPNEDAFDSTIGRNGINLRMAEFQATLLLAQMTRMEEIARRHEASAAHLDRLAAGVAGVAPTAVCPGCTRNAYHM